MAQKKRKKSITERIFGGRKIKGVKSRTSLPPEMGARKKKTTKKKNARKK
jgi:hypothetical protein